MYCSVRIAFFRLGNLLICHASYIFDLLYTNKSLVSGERRYDLKNNSIKGHS